MKPTFPRLIAALFAVIALCSSLRVGAQGNQTYEFAAKAIYDGQYIRLRWSPGNHASWKIGIEHGFDIERYTVRSDHNDIGMGEYEASKVVLATGLKPLPESAWQAYALANDLAGVAAGCLYGDSLDLLPPGQPNMGTFYNKSKESESRFGFSLFAADQDFTIAQMMGMGLVDSSDFQAGMGYV